MPNPRHRHRRLYYHPSHPMHGREVFIPVRNARKRGRITRYKRLHVSHYGPYGMTYQGFRTMIPVRHYKRSSKRHRGNPFLGNPGGGGRTFLLVAALGIGAYFLLSRGGTLFGGAVPVGYTQLGTSGYYRGPDGQLYTRTATGGMLLSPTQAAVGSPVEAQLIAAGSRLALPVVTAAAGGLATMLGNLFSGGGGGVVPSTEAQPTTELPTGGTSVTAPDILTGAGTTPLPPLPDLSLTTPDYFAAAPDTSSWYTPPTLGTPTLDLSLAPLPDLSQVSTPDTGFMGFAARHGGYGLMRRDPSGEFEARFLRRPPSYR